MAGKGSRLQPLAFSKELYPVVNNGKHFAISEFSIKALERADVDEIKLVISPDKVDIAKFYSQYSSPLSMYFYDSPSLPESCLHPLSSVEDDDICLFGLPDTLFYPPTGFKSVKAELAAGADVALGLFKVKDASKYDSVDFNEEGVVKDVVVKRDPPLSEWVWGIWGAKGNALRKLKGEISKQKNSDEKLLGNGFRELLKYPDLKISAVKIGEDYFDIGTIDAIVKLNEVIDNFEF